MLTPSELNAARAQAKALVGSDLIKAVIDRLEDIYTRRIKDSRPEQIEARERAYLQIHTLRDISLEIKKLAAEGDTQHGSGSGE